VTASANSGDSHPWHDVGQRAAEIAEVEGIIDDM
jgi:hypothetical protein